MLLPETLKLHNQSKFEFHYAYFLPWKDQMVPALKAQGVKTVCFEANGTLQMLTKIRSICQYVRQHQIQVIHSHLPWAGIVARIVGRLTNVPVVYTEHNKWERYHKITFWLNKLTFKWQNVAVAVSGDVEESIRKNAPGINFKSLSLNSSRGEAVEDGGVMVQERVSTLKLSRSQVYLTTILNGVNTSFFTRDIAGGLEIREELGIPADAPVVGTVAVFRFQKRLDLWLEIAAEILKQVPEAHFIIVGDGLLREELVQKRNALGLEGRVHMPGLITEVKPYFSAMDVYMMSSIFEGLPIALLEAMSCSCAVISTTAGGINELVEHDKSGYLCEVDDYMALAGFAVELFQNPLKRQLLSEGARWRVQQDFSIDKMVGQLEQLYHALRSPNENQQTG